MPNLIVSRPHFFPRVFKGLVLIASVALGLSPALLAQVATTTQLTVSDATAPVGVPALLTATVTDAAGHPVLLGTVTFYDGVRSLGSAQIVSGTSGAYPQGTANLNTASFSVGANSITAVFAGTKSDLKSTSTAKTVTTTGKYKATTALSGTVTGSDFTLTANMVAIAPTPPTGDIELLHVSSGATIGTLPLSGVKWMPDYVVSSKPAISGHGLVAGDFNGDGFADLVTGGVSVVLGKGDGTFLPAVNYPALGGQDNNVYAGDFNNDGKLDLVESNSSDFVPFTSSEVILLGNGDGSFRAPVSIGSLSSGADAYVADLDRDGNLDMVFIGTSHENNIDTPEFAVLLGNGDGSFKPAKIYTTVPALYFDSGEYIRAGDLNGDGFPDLVAITEFGYTVFLNQGDGTFVREKASAFGDIGFIYGVALGDISGDGKLDMVISGTYAVTVTLGNGDGTFQAQKSLPLGNDLNTVGQAVLVDTNQDGKLDIALGNYGYSPLTAPSYGLQVFLGNGDGTFQTLSGYVPNFQGDSLLITADFNSDGRPDFAVANSALSADTVILGGQAASLTLAKENLGPGTTTVVADYSGDQVFDANTSNTVPLSTDSANFSGGFPAGGAGLQLNDGATVVGGALQLTDGEQYKATSAYTATPVSIRSFVTDFTFQIPGPGADGFTFTIQNAGPTALGGVGGELGYAGIHKSAAIKFDIHNNDGEGSNSVGLYLDGAKPTTPAIDLYSSVVLNSGHPIRAHITYDGKYITLTMTDTVTKVSVAFTWALDLPTTVGGTTAYVGFTAATGGRTSTQTISSWTYHAQTPPPDFPSGIMNSANLQPNGGAFITSHLMLASGGANEARSVFYTAPQNVQAFTTDFQFTIAQPAGLADGLTFTIQNEGPGAVGGAGGGLGYKGIEKSVAVKFDIFDNDGEGKDSTGLYTDGANPTVPALDMTSSGIDLTATSFQFSYHHFDSVITYDGKNLTMTITDLTELTAHNSQLLTFTHTWPIDIPAIVGGPTAYVGFTGGTGGQTSDISVGPWTYVPGMP